MMRASCLGRLMAAASTMAALTGPGSVTLHGQDQTHEPVIVCVGVDRLLRSVKTTQPCGEGEKRYALSEAKSELEDPKVIDTGEPKGAKHPSEARVGTLEEEVRQLQRELIKMHELMYRAPFVVTDKAGKPIFVVQETPAGPSVEVLAKGVPAVQFGMGPKGNPGVRVRSPSGKIAASLGAVLEGGFGGVHVYDGTSELPRAFLYGRAEEPMIGVSQNGVIPLAALTVNKDGKPRVAINNQSGVAVASLLPGIDDDGVLRLGDAAGNTMVEAGIAEGVGQVRAYPLGNPGAGLLGMPGTFISGRKQK